MKSNRIIKNSLMTLVEHDNKEEIRIYLETFLPGINDDVKTTAFLYACRIGKLEIAKILLEFVTPNCRYSDGQTAIMLVSQLGADIRGILDFIDLLIVKGCEVDLVDFCGKSALHWATINNSIWAVRTLIAYRCSINSVDLHGFTPLIYAAKLNLGLVASLLIHSGADLMKSSKQQGTAIHQAIRYRSIDVLKLLIIFVRHLNILDSRNQCPIDLAVLLNDSEIVSILTEANKPVEINRRPPCAPFRTPLEQACQKNNIEIVSALLKAGADVNYPLEFAFELDKPSCRSLPVSPLMFAVKCQNIDLLNLLLLNGADVNIRCPKSPGHSLMATPLTLANELGNKEIIRLLEGTMKPMTLTDINDEFTAACYNLDVAVVSDVMKKHSVNLGQFLLKNGAPVILELFRDSIDSGINNELLLDLFASTKSAVSEIINPKVAESLSKKNFGSSMQFYRCAWLKLAEQFPSYLVTIPREDEYSYVKFIISFIECLFMKMKIDDVNLIKRNPGILDVFPRRLIRWSMHSTTVIKSILISKSLYNIAVLFDINFNENLVFWDQNFKQPLDVCEFALFFDNIDAAIILNLSCGLSLKCINEYDTLPYVPEIMNRSIEYNDVDKINTLKYLSRHVKPLRTLCKYMINKCVPCEVMLANLPGLSASVLSDLSTDLSKYICDFDTGLPKLCHWAGIDTNVLHLNDL